VDFGNNPNISDEALVTLLRSNSATLRTLHVRNCTGVKDCGKVVQAIACYTPHIEDLDLSKWKLDDNSLLVRSSFIEGTKEKEKEPETETEKEKGKDTEREKEQEEESEVTIIIEPEPTSFVDRCRSLRRLYLAYCSSLTDVAMVPLIRNQAKERPVSVMEGRRPPRVGLRVLDLSRCSEIGNRTLTAIATYCSHPKKLYLAYCPSISEEGIDKVSENSNSARNLRVLNLRGIRSVHAPVLRLEGLVELCLSECDKISDEHLKRAITPSHMIEKLKLSHTLISDATLDHLALTCKGLRVLKASGCANISHPTLDLPNLAILVRARPISCHLTYLFCTTGPS